MTERNTEYDAIGFALRERGIKKVDVTVFSRLTGKPKDQAALSLLELDTGEGSVGTAIRNVRLEIARVPGFAERSRTAAAYAVFRYMIWTHIIQGADQNSGRNPDSMALSKTEQI